MRKTLAVLLACGLPLLGGWDWLTSPDRDVEKGNRLFEEGKYQEALEAFREAEEGGGDPSRLQYDLGTAYYKLAESLPEGEAKREELFEKAELAFRRGAESQDPVLKSSSYYNAGNALFQRGEYREAVGSYRKALRASPENDQARYNLELALRKLERRSKKRRSKNQGERKKKGGGQQPKDQQGQGGQGQDQERKRPEGQQGSGERDRPEQEKGESSSEEKEEGESGSDSQPRQESPPEAPGQGERSEPPSAPPEVPPARPDWGGDPGASGTPRSGAERKLDALERRSRRLRKRKLRSESRRSSGHRRLEPKKDW